MEVQQLLERKEEESIATSQASMQAKREAKKPVYPAQRAKSEKAMNGPNENSFHIIHAFETAEGHL